MIKKRRQKINNVLYMAALAAFLCGLVALFMYKTTMDAVTVPLNEGWTVNICGKTQENVDMSQLFFDATGKEDDVELRTTLPATNFHAPTVAFLSCHSVVDIYLDGEHVYSYGSERHEKNRLVGYGYHFVELSGREYAGAELVIKLHVTENDAFTSIQPPYLVNEGSVSRSILKDNLMSLVSGLFLVSFGLIFMLVTLLTGSYAIDGKQMVALSAFGISLGLWTLCSHHILQLFVPNLWEVTSTEFFAFFSAPLSILLYFRKTVREMENMRWFKIFYRVVCMADLLFFVTFNFCELTNLMHYPQLQTINLFFAAGSLVVGTVVVVVNIREKAKQLLMVGITVFIVTTLFDFTKFYLQKYVAFFGKSDFNGVASLGCVIFLCCLLASFYIQLNEDAENRGRQALLEQQAYTDALTGLFNRRRLEEEVEKLDEEGLEYGIFSFDLNNLKYVNDNLGHLEGDTLINTFAWCLKAVFSDDTYLVCRTGGDEFLVLAKAPRHVDREKLIDALEAKMVEKNREISPLSVTTAYGYARSTEVENAGYRQACQLSDDRMYENKRAFKEVMANNGNIVVLKN